MNFRYIKKDTPEELSAFFSEMNVGMVWFIDATSAWYTELPEKEEKTSAEIRETTNGVTEITKYVNGVKIEKEKIL